MALPATDPFTRGNGPLGPNWTTCVFANDPQIESNTATGSGGADDAAAYWNADTPDNDQYAQVVIADAENYCGPAIRMDADDFVYLEAAKPDNKWVISWYDGGDWTQIGSDYSTSPQDSDVAKITVESTTFKGYVNTVERISGSEAGAPASGYGGINQFGNDHNLDDFEVGNMAAAAGQPTMLRGTTVAHFGRQWHPRGIR